MNKALSPKDIINSGMCIGCGSCVAQTSTPTARMDFDKYGQLRPYGLETWLSSQSERFSATCPFSPSALNEDLLATDLFSDNSCNSQALGRYQKAYVGYASESDFRAKGSSGGMITWVASELLRKGLIDGVVHVVAVNDPQQEKRYFKYSISRTEAEVLAGAKSRYYPIELSTVLKLIKEVPGRYAVVGLPCFIKAIQLLRKEDSIYQNRIRFTLGLVCGHLKSARLVDSFALQMNVRLKDIQQVEFRRKINKREAYWYNATLTLQDGRIVDKDWRYMADGDFGAGFFMYSACNFCDDVLAETADISFGDAWITPYALDGRGNNVVVVRSQILERILSQGISEQRIKLKEVDETFIEHTQAAGLRQRREGLSYRLTWAPKLIKPSKRVPANAEDLKIDRKLIYRCRYLISLWSHRVFGVTWMLNIPSVYFFWARVVKRIYYRLSIKKK